MYNLKKSGITIHVESLSNIARSIHTFEDFELYMISQSIETPEQIKNFIEVPGLPEDTLDATFWLYEYPIFKRRKATWKFVYFPSSKKFESYKDIMTQINLFLAGNKCTIRCDDDPSYTYSGYLNVKTNEYNGDFLEIEFEGDLEPYKEKECYAIFNKKGTYEIDTGIAPTVLYYENAVKDPEDAESRYHTIIIDDDTVNKKIWWRYKVL